VLVVVAVLVAGSGGILAVLAATPADHTPRTTASRAVTTTAPARPVTGQPIALHPPPLLYPGLMGALRTSDPWALPPLMLLGAPAPAPGSSALLTTLRRAVRADTTLAFAPAARRVVDTPRVKAAVLQLLARLPRTAGPYLVLAIDHLTVTVQATNLRGTIAAIDLFQRLPQPLQPTSLQLIPASANETLIGAPPPSTSPAVGYKAVQIALHYLGIPYVWGGATPQGGFDCSGLVMYVYAQLGIHLDHYTGLQWLEGRRIPVDQLQPGDILFFIPEHGDPGHEGMYIGGGKFIQAPHTGTVVQITDLAAMASVYIGAVRPY
jgi:hypothetical protein